MHLADPVAGTRRGAESPSMESKNENRLVKGWSEFCSRNSWLPSVIALAVIVGVEAICFAGPYKKTGFYLDDWLMLKQLSFGPQNYFELIFKYLTTDPRVIIRPIEALHFGSVFYFSGADPVGWRVSNMVMEVVSAFLAFLIVARLSSSRLLGLLASLFLVTYPTHDSTHYWAVCSCVSLSLTLYLASLWATLKAANTDNAVRNAVTKGRTAWLAAAYVCFALSIYGYEPFLPLCALNVVAYVMLTFGFKPVAASFTKLVLHSLPYAAIIGSLLCYQRFIAPMVIKVALHKIHLEPGLILSTVFEGLRVSSPIATAPFISAQVGSFVQSDDMNGGAIARLVILAVVVAVGVALTVDVKQVSRRTGLVLIALGLFTTVVSYTIFGLNPEYTPTLITLVNRINTGAAFGLSIVFAGLAALVISAGNVTKRSYRVVGTAAVSIVLLLLFTLTNWNLSRPWEISWAVQKRTFDAFRARKAEFKDTDSVVLLNCPRYVDATPVFDGPWDFEQGLHLALGRSDIKGGVVSERITVGRDSVQDVTLGFACAEYPYRNLVLVTPGLDSVTKVTGGNQFIETVEREATTFKIADDAIANWRTQMSQGTRRKKNGVLAPIAPNSVRQE